MEVCIEITNMDIIICDKHIVRIEYPRFLFQDGRAEGRNRNKDYQ